MTTIYLDETKTMYLRAVLEARAKRDVREYLTGIHFNGEDIVATNGHTMFCFYSTCQVPEPVTLTGFKLPVKVRTVRISIGDEVASVVGFDKREDPVFEQALGRMFGFPTRYRGILESAVVQGAEHKHQVALNIEYVYAYQKTLKAMHTQILPTTNQDMYRLEFGGNSQLQAHEYTCVLMRCRT